MDQKRIGSFLRELRTEKGLTQEQLAEKLNVSSRTVSRWENGNNMPDLSIVVELADFYDIDIRELFNGERKSEKMNEDLKETLEAVAEYSAEEKNKLKKELTTYTAGSVVCFALLVIIIMLNLTRVHSAFQMFATFLSILGLIYSSTSVVKLRQLTGKMNKKSFNNYITILLIIAAVFVAVAIFFILLAEGIPFFGWTVE
ncbi:MAG: helix-turn-helix domain-containing protein [Ruminococcus sp.]|nr:helix-turn-helix domain-containing protein [Ruminococcus sp.]